MPSGLKFTHAGGVLYPETSFFQSSIKRGSRSEDSLAFFEPESGVYSAACNPLSAGVNHKYVSKEATLDPHEIGALRCEIYGVFLDHPEREIYWLENVLFVSFSN